MSLNGAFAMFDGPARVLFPLIAKGLAVNPLTVPIFLATATPSRVRRMLEGDGQAGSTPRGSPSTPPSSGTGRM